MANTRKPEVSKQELENAKNLWADFTVAMKWAVIATIALLALMALFLVN